MSKRLTRKQIKEDIRHDELQTALSSTYDQIQSHQKLIVGALVAVIVILIGVAASRSIIASRNAAASEELARAIKIFNAPVQEEGAKPDDPENPSFATDEERTRRAKEALSAISGGSAETLADLYLGDIALREGDREAARTHWQSYLKHHKDDILAVSVQVNLFRMDREDGKAEQVAEELQARLDAEKKSLPEDLILFELAETLDMLDRNEEAAQYYQRILDDFPQSTFASKARQKTAT